MRLIIENVPSLPPEHQKPLAVSFQAFSEKLLAKIEELDKIRAYSTGMTESHNVSAVFRAVNGRSRPS